MNTMVILMIMTCVRCEEIKKPIVKKQTIEESCQEIMDALDGYSIEVQ